MANINNVFVDGTIENFICKILANRRYIGCLYDALDLAQTQRSIGSISYFTFEYPTFGKKTYNSLELINLSIESQNSPLSTFFADLNLDNIVRIFFARRFQISQIYCNRKAGLENKAFARTRFFTFINPYQQFIATTPESIRISQCDILKIDCMCQNMVNADIFEDI